jgi:hypothetical protein
VVIDRLGLRGPDVRIVDAEEGAVLLEFSLEDLSFTDLALRGAEGSLGAVGVRGPELRMRRDFLFAPNGAPRAEKKPAGPGADLGGYKLANLQLDSGRFIWLTDMGPLSVALRLHAQDVTLAEGQSFPVRLEVEIEDGRLALEGRVGALPPSFEGKVAWQEMPFPPLALASRPDLGEWLRSCRARGDVEVSFHLAKGPDGRPPRLRVVGQTVLEDFAVADPQGGEQVSAAWQAFEIVAREVVVPLPAEGAAPTPIRVDLERVRIAGADLRYALPSPALDALRAPEGEPSSLAPAPDASPPPPEVKPPGEEAGEAVATGTPVEVTLGSLAIEGAALRFEDRRGERPQRGSVEGLDVAAQGADVRVAGTPTAAVSALDVKSRSIRFDDERISPAYHGHLRDFSMTVKALRWPGPEASDVRVRGRSADGGSFSLTGKLGSEGGNAVLQVRDLALPPFNPYATNAAGYELGGKASLDTKLRIRGARYEARNDLSLKKLDVTSRDPGDFERRFGVPLDVALALLRDPAGNITLSIPVTVDEGGTRTGVGTVIAGAIRQALVGALTAPLKILGAGFSALAGAAGGGGNETAKPLTSAPGEAALEPEADESLSAIAELLARRPELAVRLRGRTGTADRPRVAEQILIERVQGDEGLPPLEDAGFLARRRVSGALEERGKGGAGALEPADQALLERYVASVEVTPDRLAALARARAESARQALVEGRGVDPERVDAADSPAPEGEPGVSIELEARATE